MDPIFGASVAAGITGTDTSNWNNAGFWLQNGNDVYYNDGNVGIGTNNPSQKLEVEGSIMADSIKFTDNAYIYNSSVNRLELYAGDRAEMRGGSTRIRAQPSFVYFTIGSSTPSYMFNATGVSIRNGWTAATEAIDVIGNGKFTGTLIRGPGTIADNDATPDVDGGEVWTYAGSANSVTVTDLDNPKVGAIYRIVGNSDTYTITINDSGNFNLSANFVGGVDDVLTIYVQADNDYIEISRSDN